MEPVDLAKFTSRKAKGPPTGPPEVPDEVPDSLAAWIARYRQLAVAGVRSDAVAAKIALHLARFRRFFSEAYGHDRLSTCLRRDVLAWQGTLRAQGLAPAKEIACAGAGRPDRQGRGLKQSADETYILGAT